MEIGSLYTPVEQKANTTRSQNSLLHWEALLVTSTHDLEDITLELLQPKKHITPIFKYEISKRVMDQEISNQKIYLAQSITTDLLGDPSVIKGTPVVDRKVYQKTKQNRAGRNSICLLDMLPLSRKGCNSISISSQTF
jgi:hypothetical protein